jgi:hypothetical protein
MYLGDVGEGYILAFTYAKNWIQRMELRGSLSQHATFSSILHYFAKSW